MAPDILRPSQDDELPNASPELARSMAGDDWQVDPLLTTILGLVMVILIAQTHPYMLVIAVAKELTLTAGAALTAVDILINHSAVLAGALTVITIVSALPRPGWLKEEASHLDKSQSHDRERLDQDREELPEERRTSPRSISGIIAEPPDYYGSLDDSLRESSSPLLDQRPMHSNEDRFHR